MNLGGGEFSPGMKIQGKREKKGRNNERGMKREKKGKKKSKWGEKGRKIIFKEEE